MKKFLSVFFVVAMIFGTFIVDTTDAFGKSCYSATTLKYRGNQDPDDNEFLYPDKNNFDKAMSAYETSGHADSGSAVAFECDDWFSKSCEEDHVVHMKAGHVFKGKVINQAKDYQCIDGLLDDYWAEVGSGMCHTRKFGDIGIGETTSTAYNYNELDGLCRNERDTNGETFVLFCERDTTITCKPKTCKTGYKVVGDKCVENGPTPNNNQCTGTLDNAQLKLNLGGKYPKNISASQCRTLNATYDSNGTAFQLDCVAGPKFRCCPTKCSGNMFADTAGCQCRKPGIIINKSCTEKRKDKPVGVACCNLEDARLARYDSTQNVCICNDVNAKFEIDTSNGTGRCVTQQIPQCDTTTGARLNQNTKECECVSPELRLNADGVSCSCADSNKVYKNGKCEYSEEYLLLIKLKEIREVRARLDGIMNGFKVSVWKDAEGNFNTARLASDSIAGVVLGTVGGVVTSVVVKKNQLKKGFEAIQCAIGGQTVADYNDEFVVGPAR